MFPKPSGHSLPRAPWCLRAASASTQPEPAYSPQPQNPPLQEPSAARPVDEGGGVPHMQDPAALGFSSRDAKAPSRKWAVGFLGQGCRLDRKCCDYMKNPQANQIEESTGQPDGGAESPTSKCPQGCVGPGVRVGRTQRTQRAEHRAPWTSLWSGLTHLQLQWTRA